MNNNLDSKLQRTMEQAPARLSKASLKALNSTAEKAPSTRPAAINRPATTQFLNTIAHEQDEVGEALARSINRVNQSLSQASHSPDSEQAPVDSQAKSMAVYTRLAGKLIDRDQGLQEKVAHNLSEPTRPVKTREAAHSLQQAMAQLPERLQEGTSSGKELAKFMVQNLVQLANTKNMGAGLERDLAMRQINVPHHPVNARQQQASSKVLAASINYIKQNQPEVLAKVSTQEPPQQATATSPQPASTTNHERHSVTSAEIEGKTYLDIFKQRSAQSAQQAQSFHPQGRGVPYDEMSAEISQRIHELITKAASNAKSGNLIKLSPEEAANFDRTVSAARERAQGLDPNNTRLQSMLDSGTSTQQPSKVGQGPDGVLPPEHKAHAEPVRGLSLSELSARAAKLQQQFRDERQRIVSEGKLPNPAQLPETTFAAPKVTTEPSNSERQQALNHVESNTRELRAALAQAKAALAARIAQGATNTIEQDGTTQPTKAEAAPKSESVATKPEPALSKADAKPAEAKPTDVKPADTKHTEAKPADTKLADTKPTDAKPTTAETTAKPTADLAKTETQVKSEAPAKSEVAAKPAPETASKALDLSLLKNTSLNVSYQAVQSTLYGDLDVIPGMTIPVSHFGDLQNEVITPNDKAIEVLKAQARVLAAQQQAQANSNLTELVSSAPKQPASAPAQPQVITPQSPAPEATAQPAPQPAQTAQTQPAQTSTQSAQAAPQVATSGPQQAAAQVTEQAQAAAQPAQAQTAHTGTQPAQTAPQVVTSGPQQAAAQVTEQAQAAAQQTPAQAQPAQTAPQSAQAAPQVVTSGPQQAAAQVAEQAQAAAQQAQAQAQPAQTGTQSAQAVPQVVTSGPQQAAAQVAEQAQAAAQQAQAQAQPAQTGTQSTQATPQVVTSGPQQAAAEIAAQAQAAAQQAQAQTQPAQTGAQSAQQAPQVVTSGPQQAAAEIAAQAQAAAQQTQAQTQPAPTGTQSAQPAPQVVTSGPQQAAAEIAAQAQAAAQQAQAQTQPAPTGTQSAQPAPQVVTSGPQQAAAEIAAQAQAAAQQAQAQAQPAQAGAQSAQPAPQVVTSGPQQAAAEIAAQAQAAAQQAQTHQQAQTQAQPAPTGTQSAQQAPQVVTSGSQQAAAEIAAQAQAAAQQAQAQTQPAQAGAQSAQQGPQVVTSGPQQAAAEIAAQAAAQQAHMQPAPSAPQPEPQVVTSGPQQAAAEIAAQAQAAAAERAPQVTDGPDTIITRTPVAEPEVVPSREPVVAPEPRSVGARYARLYGQMQTGNYDEAQIKHPTSDPLRDKASDAKLRADQSVVLSTLSKLEQLVAQQQQEAAGKTPAEHLSARLNAGATTSQSSVGADFDYAAVPDSGILRDNRQSSGAATKATFNEESAKIAAATERARAFSVDAKPSEVPDEIASHASATDVKQTKEFLAAQAQEYRVAQDLAQEKEQAQQAAAKFIAEQEAEQEQLERKAAELALEQELAEEQNEQALTALQEAQEAATAAVAQNAQAANSAPNSVTGAPSLLASQGSSILNPSASDKAGTASDFNRLYREAMQSEAQLRAQQRDAIEQTAKEHNAKVAGETLTLSKQRALEAQAVGSSQVNTVGDTNIRATGATIASATTNLTDAKLGATLTTPTTTTPAAHSPSTAAQGTPAQAAPTTAQGTAAQATPTTAQSTQAAPAAAQSTSPVSAGAQAVAQSAVNSATQTTAVNAAVGPNALKVGATGSVSATGATGAMGATGAGAAPGAMGTVNVGSATPMGLDEDSLQDEIIRNVMRTVPSDDLDEFNLRAGQPLSGVIADTDLTAGPNVSAMPQEIAPSFSALAQDPAPSTVVPNDHTVGAADIRAGQNAPIPEQSVVPSYEAPQEGGLLRRLASLFGRGSQSAENSTEIAQGQTASVATSALGNLKDTTADKSEMLHSLEQGRQEALRQNSLDQLFSRLNQAATNSQLPEPMQQQARKLLAALENPVNDLHTVSSWLNFVTGPLSPSSSLALALHQWAFMLLCIRFEQIGRSVDKFLKKQGKGNALGDNLAELEPAMRQAKDIAKGLDGSKSELTGSHHTSAQLLDDTLGQIERLQQQTQLTPPNQVLPRYIPLPPFYHGGKEGSLSAQHHTDEDGGKSWHLNFHFDLEHMGALEVKVKLRFPEVQISFVAERLDTLQRVQSMMPELNQHLAQMGLQSKGSNARLGHISPAAPAPSADSFRYEGATFTTNA